MLRINQFIERNIVKIVMIILLLNPIIDLFSSVFTNILSIKISIGVILRAGFLLLAIYYMGIIDKSKDKKRNIIYLILLFLYFLIFLILEIGNNNLSQFIAELKFMSKSFFFPIFLIFLYTIRNKFLKMNFFLLLIMYIYILLIGIFMLLGIGLDSYDIAKVGTVGLFNSANEISCIIGILTPFYIYWLLNDLNKKNAIFRFITFIFYLFVILSIGTKVPLLSLFITLLCVLLKKFIGFIKYRRWGMLFLYLIVLILLTFLITIIIPKTNFYKNLKIHADYLNITKAQDVIKDSELIDHFVFSQRIKFYHNVNDIYKQAPLLQKLFGMGYVKGESNYTKMVEMDYYDIFYAHGVIGFLLYYSVIAFFIYCIIKDDLFNWVPKKQLYGLSIFLILILSLFSGHVMTSPSVSIYCAIIFSIILSNPKRKLVFIANDLRVGGIETSLVNLLDKIDYKKYQVTLILEKKEGEFLLEINHHISIFSYNISYHKNILVRKSYNFLKRVLFGLLYYNSYDFSCCYATYSLMGNKLARLMSSNGTIFIHGDYTNIYPIESEFRQFFDHRKIDKFKKIVFVSNESKCHFLNYYPNLVKQCLVINNFVNEKKILSLSHQTISMQKRKNTLFVYVGRLEEKSKKISKMLKLMKELKNDYSVELWIVGDGSDRLKYEQMILDYQIKDVVKLLGSKKNPFPYMRCADYILMTSDYEGFPVVYMEAIILRKKILTTIDVTDSFISIPNKLGYILSKSEKKMINQVKKILNKDNLIYTEICVSQMDKEKMKLLEEIFDEVI